MKKLFVRSAAQLLFVCFFGNLLAQNTLSYTDNDVYFRNGIELYEKKAYPAAREEFKHFIELTEKSLTPNEFNITTAEYYAALSGLYSKSPDADIEIERFVVNHSDHPKAKVIYGDLGKYFYDEGDYARAIMYLQKAVKNLGDTPNSAEITYKLGMSYYQTKDLTRALPLLDVVKTGSSEYAPHASYYAGTINFKNENLDAALEDFKRVDNYNPYRAEVPNWIADILYRQKKYDEMLKYTEGIIANPQGRKLDNLALLTAEVYFFKPDYVKAAKYYDMFRNFKKSVTIDGQIVFRHGYSLFKTGDYKKASENFKKVASRNDLIGQQAAYYLGIASLKNADYPAASAAFDQAKNLTFDKVIQEEAQFNYAKTQIDVGNNVQGVTELQTYLKNYPGGKFEDEANEILSEVLFQSNNYASAITYIEGLKRKTPKINEAYQKLTYNQGVLEFNGEHFAKAIANFDKSLTQTIDPDIKKNATFWKAEAAYALKRDDAPDLYQAILTSGDETMKQKSRYSLGYLYYNNKDYKQALSYFKDFTKGAKTDANRQNYDDAILRMADCNLVMKNYDEALKLYDQAINSNRSDKDYALYQKALTLTFMGKQVESKAIYDKLTQQFPNSRLLDDAYYQNGVIALENTNYQDAITQFSKLLKERPKSNLIPPTLLKRATAYGNLKNYEASIQDYKVLVMRFCSSPAAQEALVGLQDALNSAGRPEEFSEALAAYKRGCPESGSVDNLEYESAKNLYLSEKYDKAVLALQNYIAHNGSSGNAYEAKYYLADSYFLLNDKVNAVKYYNQVVADNRSNFVTKSALRAGSIELSLKNFRNAVNDYKIVTTSSTNKRDIVTAWQGLVDAYYGDGKYDSTMVYSREILNNSGNIVIGAANKAQLYLGKALMQKGETSRAEEEFKRTISMAKDVNGAEAKYFMGYMEYQAKKYKESIKSMQELAKEFSDFLYWYEKGFMLIADNYIAMDDIFMAKATLKSIIENSDTPETKDTAKAKLKSLDNK